MASKRSAIVIDLSAQRDRRRLLDYQQRLHAVLEQNRGALSRLFSSGSLFTRTGTRTGRALLLAHQHLLRGTELLSQLEATLASVSVGEPAELARICRELDGLLEKTTQINSRTARVRSRGK